MTVDHPEYHSALSGDGHTRRDLEEELNDRPRLRQPAGPRAFAGCESAGGEKRGRDGERDSTNEMSMHEVSSLDGRWCGRRPLRSLGTRSASRQFQVS